MLLFTRLLYVVHPDLHSFPTRRSSDLQSLLGFRTLVLRRSPLGSRPPSPYKLTWSGHYYEVWRTAADRKSTRLNSSHVEISYAVFCLKKKNKYLFYPDADMVFGCSN